ncbi:MAG: insulinase family protein [Armatimonadota bacterium]|nr:insulinase family protein [Armatimonadota bacterium]
MVSIQAFLNSAPTLSGAPFLADSSGTKRFSSLFQGLALTGSVRATLRTFHCGVLFAIISVLALAIAGAPARGQAFPADRVSDATLPNGLHLVLKRTPGAHLTAISLWVKAGSRNETAGNNGVAHLLEHYLFGGTANGVTDRFDREIEGMGGSLNAETARDSTHFYVTVPRVSFEGAIKSLAGMIGRPTLAEDRLEIERRRAADEVAQRAQDPVQAAQQAVFAMAYQLSPYRMPVAGTPESVLRLSLDQVRSFYHTYYRPDNASLVVIGDMTLPQAVAAVRGAFDGWPKGQGELPAVTMDPDRLPTPPVRLIPLRGPSPNALLMIGFPAPSIAAPHDAVTMDLIYALVSSGSGSLVAQQLGKPGLLTGYSSDFLTTRDPGLFLIWGFTPVGQLQSARKKLLEVIDEVKTGAFSEADLARARGLLLGSYALENETATDASSGLGFYDAISSYTYAVNYEQEVQRVTRDDLRRVAAAYFKTSYAVVIAPPGTPLY